MKKFFTHNGSEQEGPFDIDDLKNKKVSRDTMVWHEGLDTWAKAADIPELKEILSITPPPFKVATEPPKIPQPEAPKKPAPLPLQKKKNSTGKIIRRTVLIILAIIGAIVVINILNNPNSVPGIKVQINTPKPAVITSRADDRESDLFKERTTVYATVQNQGGDGNVLVTFHVYQAGNDYQRTQPVYLRSNQSEDLKMTFDEVRRLSGEIKYRVEVQAQ